VARAIILASAVLFVLINLLVDLLYHRLDPRIPRHLCERDGSGLSSFHADKPQTYARIVRSAFPSTAFGCLDGVSGEAIARKSAL